ncbi:MAG: acyltransferase [Lachnospiraceae bacterium]
MVRKEITADRIYGIDILRAVACIGIVLWHIYANGNYNFEWVILEKVIASFDYLVYLFMILSGFAMFFSYYTKILQNNIRIQDFYIRRYKKIWPFFFCVVMLDMLVTATVDGVMEGILELTLLFGLLPNNSLDIVGVGWTLGVIFLFYIMFPFFCFLLCTKTSAWISLIASIIIQFMCQIYFMTGDFVIEGYRNRSNFLFCMPYFIVGGIIYLYLEEIKLFCRQNKKKIIIISSCITILYYNTPSVFGGYSLLEWKLMLLYCSWITVAISMNYKAKKIDLLQLLSKISMEIYLSHMIFYRLVTGVIGDKYKISDVYRYCLTVLLVFLIMCLSIVVFNKILNSCIIKKVGNARRNRWILKTRKRI